PRRSIRITRRPLSPSSMVTTRNPDNPRIHVQSRRDPTGPPLLVAHQERTPSNPGWPMWDRASSSRPPSRPPTPTAVRAGGRVSPQIAVLKSVNSPFSTVNSANHEYDVTADGQRFIVAAPLTEARNTPLTVVVNWTARLKK